MKITCLLITLFYSFCIAHAEEDPKKINEFEKTQPIVKDGKLWDITIDASNLKSHIIISRFVKSSTHNRFYFNFKVIKDFTGEEISTFSNMLFYAYAQDGSLLGIIDDIDSSMRKISRHRSAPQTLKKGAIFRGEAQINTYINYNANIASIKVVIPKPKQKKENKAQ